MPQVWEDEFYIEDHDKLIVLALNGATRIIGWKEDEMKHFVEVYDSNQIEVCYWVEDGDGWWCIGENEYISIYDIKSMVDGICSVVEHKTNEFNHSCQGDIFRIKIAFNNQSTTYSFAAALMMETDCYKYYYITITKENLTREELQQYIDPFFKWEKTFPVRYLQTMD